MADGIAAVKQWILEQNHEVSDLAREEDLFLAGLISSIQIVEMLVVIENNGGRRVNRKTLEPDNFRSLRAIEEKFFSEEPSN
jgi:acyl carrier protein